MLGATIKIEDAVSLSARRAWIEIRRFCTVPYTLLVALRKESVDRNCGSKADNAAAGASLSARRAWIEIKSLASTVDAAPSLSARRAWIEI